MEIDYYFCQETDLIVSDLLVWMDLDEYFENDGYSWNFFGRYAQANMHHKGEQFIRISCIKEGFDKWSNSYEYWFDISKSDEKKEFIDLIREWRSV